jgi:protein-tyrosine-phosphatase
MAEALFRYKISARPNAAEWRVESAGTWALPGYPAEKQARRALAQRGLYIPSHRSRVVNANLLQGFDLILVMEAGHKEALQLEFPQVAKRVYLLSEIVGRQHDIPDPIGGSDLEFEDTLRELDRLLEQGMGRILELVAGANQE